MLMMRFSVPFILASSSPRRRRLLEQLGMEFRVVPSDVDEALHDEGEPKELSRMLVADKAESVARLHPDSLVLAADTIVVHGGEIFGKPVDTQDAWRMLRALSGSVHTVHTGIALSHIESGRSESVTESTRVYFSPLSSDEIRTYIEGGSPMDKAGAYGIQDDHGALFVERIEGDYYNVVGLPLNRLYRLLKTHFGDLLLLPGVHR